MQAQNTQKVTKIGFTSILVLLSILIFFSIYRLQLDHIHLNKMAKSNDALKHLITMRDAAAQRALILYRMSAMDDPFKRDDLYLQFKTQAENFIKARSLLQKADTNAHYKKQYKDILPLMHQASDMHQKTIELLLSEKNNQATTLLQNDLHAIQNKVNKELSFILNTLRERMDAEITLASNENLHAETLITIIGIVILILGAIIALYVLRHTRIFENAIIKQKKIAEEASQSKTSYLSNMSHEIRTPLTAIIGFSENLVSNEISQKERLKAGYTIIRNGKHLLQLINDILDISKIEAGQLEVENIEVSPLYIIDEVSSLINNQAKHKELEFRVNYQFPLPANIHSDPVRLKQIIINLCGNAIKFTEQGSINIDISYAEATNKLIFIIRDTGIGMSEQACKKIFAPFAQAKTDTNRKFGGTGLGLTISKQLAEAMNGHLSCTSEVDTGSQFILELQLEDNNLQFINEYASDATQTPIAAPNAIPQLEGKILLAEDSYDNQELIQMYIEKTGADLTIVENGEQAVEQGLANNFQLILMDTQMPVMDGISAIELLRASGYTRAIVSLTANAMQTDKDKCFNAGADDYLAKPIDIEEFYRVLKQNLKQSNKEKAHDLSDKMQTTMKKLSAKFLFTLPEKLQAITNAYDEKDWDKLDAASHKLKGLGGSFGYPEITAISKIINDSIRSKDYLNIDKPMTDLINLCDQILKQSAA